MIRALVVVGLLTLGYSPTAKAADSAHRKSISTLIHQHAARYHVPERLIRRIIAQESGYNARARNGSLFGLMQIRLSTARGLGYRGKAEGLLEPDTNLRYGVAYLANALRVARGNPDKAVALYKRGYYHEAKRQGLQRELIAAR